MYVCKTGEWLRPLKEAWQMRSGQHPVWGRSSVHARAREPVNNELGRNFNMTSTLENQLMAWSSTHNLNWLIGFHNYVRGLFKARLEDLKNCGNNKENKLNEAALYDYDRMLHANTFLMMFSYLEEWLYLCWKSYAPNIDIVDRQGGLGRFKNIVKELGVDLSSKLWQDLKNVEEVRNCLLHANGRISLLRDPQKIREIVEKENSGLEIAKDYILITGGYLQVLNENISKIMDIMINRDSQGEEKI